MTNPLVETILAGDRRMAGRLMTRAESADASIIQDLQALYLAGGKARVIGITGPPGVGKSTTVDQMVTLFRSQEKRVAILAVDPSSPFSGGAVLGDRVRMHRHAEDEGVLIRSMAARGALGGLTPATGDALTILDAMGFDIIIVETVGVGQNEIDILNHADTVILLQTAHGGDGVQMVKAGILEIADILVVNKSDAPGSDKMVSGLIEMAEHTSRTDGWIAPVVKTEAVSGAGVDQILSAVDQHVAHRIGNPATDLARRRRQIRARVVALGDAALRRRLQNQEDKALDAQIDAVIERKNDPHALAATLAPLLQT